MKAAYRGSLQLNRPVEQPIPIGRRFKPIFMLRNLPDLHADGAGDLFEIPVRVCSHRRAGFWTQ
jgi:hypothetical protein